MQDKRWYGAAWLSVAVAALMPLSFVLSIVADTVMKGRPREVPFSVMVVSVSLSWMLCSIIVLFRLRELLNERYDFRAINTPIQFMIILLPIIGLLGAVGRIVMALPQSWGSSVASSLVFIVPIIALTIAMGVLSIVIGARLLSFEGDVASLVRPYAFLSIAGGACFALVLLIPLGALVAMAEQVLLAMLFFRAAEGEQSVEFV